MAAVVAKKRIPAPPKKLWKLLELALTDLKKVERSKKYVVEMSYWVSPPVSAGDKCEVCMAGAIMACELNVDTTVGADSLHAEEMGKWSNALMAVNELRQGDIAAACWYLFGTRKHEEYDRHVVDYKDDKELWHSQMDQILIVLKAKNI